MINKFINKLGKVCMAFMMLFVTVFQTDVMNVEAASHNVSYRFVPSWQQEGANKWGDATILKVDGKTAFCIDSRYGAKEGTNQEIQPKDAGLSDGQMQKLALIVWYGYRSRGETDTNYLLTQNVIWQYLKKDGQQFTNSTYPYKGKKMQDFYNSVMNKVNHFHDKASFHNKTYTGEKGKELAIADTKKVVSGLRIKSVSGGKARISGNTLYVTPDGTNDKMTITFDRGMSASQTKANFVVRGSGKDEFGNPHQPVSPLTGKDPYGSRVYVNVTQRGNLKIAKQDEEGNKVPGTSFKLSAKADMSSAIGTYKTGSDGTVTVKNLKVGTYYVQETAVPNHLILDNKVHEVTVSKDKTTTFTATNKFKRGNLKIAKEDEDGNRVPNTSFKVSSKSNMSDPVGTYTTQEDGTVTVDGLKIGTYYVQETAVPDHLVLDDSIHSVNVEYNKTASFTAINKFKTTDLLITKQDEDGNRVPNTSFVLSKSMDMTEPIGTYTTGEDGTVLVTDLAVRTYYVQETAVPDHLILDDTVYSVVLQYGVTASYTATNNWKHGNLKIKKESVLPDITENNKSYSLTGAEYGVYSDETTEQLVDTLVIGEDGWSQVMDLRVGTYYIKETKAPIGYILNEEIVEVKVIADETTVLADGTFKDIPQSEMLEFILNKVDDSTGENIALGDGTFENAEFTIRYYDGIYDDGVDPATLGASAKRTWVFKTDSNGQVKLSEEYLARGDALYKNSTGDIVFPLGTVTVQETKAPDGYRVNAEVFVKNIISNGTDENVESFGQVIVVPENVIKLHLTKYQKDKITTISNVKFKHTKPDGSSEFVFTDEKGTLDLVGLVKGLHKIKEVEVKTGYEINPTEVELEVLENGTIKVITDLHDTGISYTEEQKDGYLEVEDKVSTFSFEIIKINTHDKLLDGAEFTLYSDRECNDEIQVAVTNEGKLQFNGLEDRTHYYLKETKAPAGYRIPTDENGLVHVYEIYTESNPELNIFDIYIDGEKIELNNDQIEVRTSETGNKIVSMKVVNNEMHQLPNTGSNATIIMLSTGVVFMIGGLLINKKKKEKSNV